MRMSILEIEYKHIRKINDLKLSFTKSDGTLYKTNFIMMANGTGKTTTIMLLKALLDGTAINWEPDVVKSFAPQEVDEGSRCGEFIVTVKFDNKTYKYFLELDYINGKASIDTLLPTRGRENRLEFPESFRGLFTSEFVNRFVFDGEQAEKSMDSSSNEAEEMIKNLYRLDEFDKILVFNQKILEDIQNTNGSCGSGNSLTNLRTRKNKCEKTRDKLDKHDKELHKNLENYQAEKKEKESLRDKIDQNYEQLNMEKSEIQRKVSENKKDIDSTVFEILDLTKSPYLLSRELCDRMVNLGNSMTKLKLPKASSRDFFVELANSGKCVCGRCIGAEEKKIILKNSENYLGNDQQAVLNTIKSSLLNCKFDERMVESFQKLYELRDQENMLNNRRQVNAEELIKAGGEEAEELRNRINELNTQIVMCQKDIERIESKDENDDELNEENNFNKAVNKIKYYDSEIAKATLTNEALNKKNIVEKLVLSIKEHATTELKKQIIRKTNEKLKKVIKDDNIEIEEIDKSIKLKGRDGASEGQTLSVAYCFLGTMFEDSELEFPFIIDSPTGKMDLEKRNAVAEIIPKIFEQMIAFVQSAEKERFADRFYKEDKAQFLTVVVPSDDNSAELHVGVEFFDSYQQENEGDES